MDEQQRVARDIEGQRAQKLTVSEAAEMLVNDGRPPTAIQDGLEIEGAGPSVDEEPAPMEQIDPGWSHFQQRVEATEDEGWLAAANAGEAAAVAKAVATYQTTDDETALLDATLNLVTNAPPETYDRFLAMIHEDDPDYAQALATTVVNTLSEWSGMQQEREFGEMYAESERMNVEDVAATLGATAAKRGISDKEMELAARAYTEVTGQPLRLALSATMPGEEREKLAYEVAVAAEVDQKAERMRAFKMGFFQGGTDVTDGLTINGRRAGGELPPSVLDADYNRYLTDQQIRKADAERATRPAPDQSAYEIKRQIVAPEQRDWRAGLTTASGRKTSVQEISANDPDSMQNQQQRQRQRESMRIANATGGRRV